MATETPLILLVDSDSQWLEATSNYLFREGIDSLTATEGKKALNILKKVTPHMILINIFLEDPDGVELCQQIRTLGTPSLIVLLAETHQEYALLAGFEAGADDFIYKDTKIKLLLYKIKALLRLSSRERVTPPSSDSFSIRPDTYSVIQKDKEIFLPKKEFELLSLLASKPNTIFTREEITQAIWDKELSHSRTLDVHIRNIRSKIEGINLKTIKGVGYKLTKE